MFYGNYFNESFCIDLLPINEEQVEDILVDAIKEGLLEEALEENYSVEEDILEEGANTEYSKISREYIKEYKKLLRESKKAFRKANYTEAKAKLKEANSKLTECSKAIKKIPSNELESCIGALLLLLHTAVNVLVIYLSFTLGVKIVSTSAAAIMDILKNATVGKFAAGLGGGMVGADAGSRLGKELSKLIYNITYTIKDLKNPNNKDINLYRRNILSYIMVLRDQTIFFEQAINNKLKQGEK